MAEKSLDIKKAFEAIAAIKGNKEQMKIKVKSIKKNKKKWK